MRRSRRWAKHRQMMGDYPGAREPAGRSARRTPARGLGLPSWGLVPLGEGRGGNAVHTCGVPRVVGLRVRLVASPLLADGMETGCGPLAQAGGFSSPLGWRDGDRRAHLC
jgi:hypothetical protein